MEDEKENSGRGNLKRTIVIAIAALGLLAVIALTGYKIKKSFNPPIVEVEDTSKVLPSHHKPVVVPVKVSDSTEALKTATLYKQYFSRDTVPQTYPTFLLDAFSAYALGDYSYMLKLDLANVPDAPTAKEPYTKQQLLQLAHYYKGIAALMTDDTEHAITHLQWVISNPANEVQFVKAKWYLALAYLNVSKTANTIELLKQVERNRASSNHALMAANLLKELQHQ